MKFFDVKVTATWPLTYRVAAEDDAGAIEAVAYCSGFKSVSALYAASVLIEIKDADDEER